MQFKRLAAFLVILVVLFCLLPITAFANSPPPSSGEDASEEIGKIGDPYSSTTAALFYIFLAVVGMIFTVLSEYVVSIPFGIWLKNGKTVVLVNLISQILMHLLYGLLCGVLFWKYIYAVLLLEILVYAGEYLYYRHKLADISPKKCLAFTLTANTVSLAIGIAVIAYLR